MKTESRLIGKAEVRKPLLFKYLLVKSCLSLITLGKVKEIVKEQIN